MDGLGYACAIVLAAVLVWAAAAKLGRSGATAEGFTALKLPAATALACMVPVAELVVAVTLLAAPRAGGVAARDLTRDTGFVLLAVGAVTAARPEVPDATPAAMVVVLTAVAAACLRAFHARARSSPSP